MIDVYDEYEEYEKHLIHDKRWHIDMAKRWHAVDDGIENFVTKHGTNALSFFLGAVAAVCFATGIYLPFTGKIVLIILGHILVIVAFVLALLAHRANKVFKRKLSESIFFTFCFPHMIDTQTQIEKSKAAEETNRKIRDTICLLDRCTDNLLKCTSDEKEKHDELVRITKELSTKLHQLSFSQLPYNYDRCASELKDSGTLSNAVVKAYPTVHS